MDLRAKEHALRRLLPGLGPCLPAFRPVAPGVAVLAGTRAVRAGSAHQDSHRDTSRRAAGGLLVAARLAPVETRSAAVASVVRVGRFRRAFHGLGGEDLHRREGRGFYADANPALSAGGPRDLLLCRQIAVAWKPDIYIPSL